MRSLNGLIFHGIRPWLLAMSYIRLCLILDKDENTQASFENSQETGRIVRFWKKYIKVYSNDDDADQPVCLCSLIRLFFVRLSGQSEKFWLVFMYMYTERNN